MSFLQPVLLAALPLVALPIIIHLINQRRYQSIRWAAMMFLLAANRMSRGYARIRQWLIMAFRMLVIAGLIFAVSRPLAGGWLGLAGGGKADTTIVLVDRSPSMQQGAPGGGSKLETGLRQLVPSLKTLGSSRWILIDSVTNQPRELEGIDALLTSTNAGPTSASADIPAMLQAAQDYIRASKPGRTEIWICSDIRQNDWNAESGRWASLREAFLGFPQGVRFHLLAFPQAAVGNLGIRVTEVRRQKAGDGVELLVSLRITREGGGDAKESVPVRFEIDGARSEIEVELVGSQAELKDHRIPLSRGRERGWGRVSIPADGNPADNDSWFVFDEPATRRAVVVAEDEADAWSLRLAAEIPPGATVKCEAETVAPGQLDSVDWDATSLLVWMAPLPEGEASERVNAFVKRGGYVIFFPPREPGTGEFSGVRWTSWSDSPQDVAVENWRGDEDLLARSAGGAPLPVGELGVRRSCGLSGEFTPLATLRGGAPLLARVATSRGGVYFCTTTPAVGDSSLATDGVVLYVLVQRALAGGAAALEGTRQVVAGDPSAGDTSGWKPVAGAVGALSTDYASHAGIYAAGERLLAVNPAAAEGTAPILADERVAGLFRGLDFSRVDAQAGGAGSLIQEVWRLFLAAMMVSMVAEAALCLPRSRRVGAAS